MLLIRMKYISLLVSCIIVYALPLYSQYAEKDFVRYTVRNGLTDNIITCLQQDEQGYMWIGTDAGLNRFDGNTFRVFHPHTAPLKLLSESIWRMKSFGKQGLGLMGKGGFQVVNTKDYSVRNFIIPDSTAFTNHLNSAWEAVELPGQSYALSTASGFYVFDPAGKLTLRFDKYNVNDIGKKRILYGRDFFKLSHKRFLLYVDENRLGLYDAGQNKYSELNETNSDWYNFMHSPSRPEQYWVVKHKLSEQEFVFVPRGADEIVYYQHDLKKWTRSPLPKGMTDSLNWESRTCMLNDSTFLINSRTNGFYIYQLNRRTGAIYCDGKKFLRNYKIMCLYVDRDKRLWVGTTEGLLKQQLQTAFVSAYWYQPKGGEKYTGGFSCVYKHRDLLYAARFSNSKGLAVIDPVTMQLIKEIDFYGNISPWNEIRTIEMYHKDTLWIGSNGGLLWFDTRSQRYGKVMDEKKYPWATSFYPVLTPARPDGNAWMISMLGGKLVRYHIPSRTFTLITSKTNPALPFDRVKNIVFDSYGDMWVSGHSMARFNYKKQVFDTLITVYGGLNKFSDDIVAIRADHSGSLWLHNMYNGLLEYKVKEKQFVSYTMKDGLPSDVLQALSPVIHDKLWLAGNNHLTLFDTRTKQFTVYNAEDGFPEQSPTGRRMYYDSTAGQIYLCCNEYLVRFPLLPEKKLDHSSGLLTEELIIDNKRTVYWPGDDLEIKYNENNLSFNYSIIDFEKSNYQFAYRLNPASPWTSVGSQRTISLNNLPPGNYSIELKASGKPGIEKTKTFFITIDPPLWKRSWFILLAVLSVAGVIYFIYRKRVRNIRQKANIDKMLSQTEMKALQAQMNPHFIFNSLNSIREMILNNENKDASHYLSKFAHLMRITLDQSTQTFVSLRNTKDYLERYMEMESIRNSLFTWEINVDEKLDIDEVGLPPMLLQPFIENALWHGVSANNKKIHVKIDFIKEGDNLVCRIDDNGMGIRQSQKNKTNNTTRHQPHGVDNIKNRVNLLNEKYDLRAHIDIYDKKEISEDNGTGTIVTLQLPIEIKES